MDNGPLDIREHPSTDALARGEAEASLGHPRAASERATRRRFLWWGAGSVAVASGVFGKLVGFSPSARADAIDDGTTIVTDLAAGDFACKPGGCSFDCRGLCEPYQSCCRVDLVGNYCCCVCPSGPASCNPQVFEAHQKCGTFKKRCCCSVCR